MLWLPRPGLSERAVANPRLLQEGGDRRWLVCSVSASKIESFLVLHLLNCLNCLFPFLKSLGDCNCSHSQAPTT